MNPFRRRILLFSGLVIALLFAATVPLEQSVSGPCRIEPSGIWYIARGGAGQLITGWERNQLGTTCGDLMLQFEQPDWVTISLAPTVKQGAWIRAGDTLAWIESREGYGRQQVLEAELERARRELAALESGARPVDVEVAVQQRQRAQAAKRYAEIEHKRLCALNDSGFVTLADVQRAEAELDEKAAELSYANAQVNALSSGSRAQEIAVGRAEIARLESAVESARRVLGHTEVITAPIAGVAELETVDTGVLLRLLRTDTLCVIAQIPEPAAPVVDRRGPMSVMLHADRTGPRSVVVHEITFSKTVVPGAFVCGLIENQEHELTVGMTGYASCSIGRRSLLAGTQARIGKLRL